ncbi:DNA replication and repair protein RecF [Burkholderia lata]|uniref:AAA family ATPase n=1 Tax=Burkholderia lata (strain ATCC 17760 / DSM 23089 / LMG 22485 / NCIMB 9086 / R18194 / 383) TaxID=482957 RepID=UPI00145388E9|nr:ATP-binding protein [Burkholderia lata]VWB92856.1 DNA replication and repair protein RecF [Burkholderia lata]
MLLTLHIYNFRSCVDVRLSNLGEITALVGRNGAGKTNILQAIEWLGGLISGTAPDADDLDGENGRMAVEFELDSGHYWYSVNRHSRYDFSSDNTPEVVSNFEEELYRVDASGRQELFMKRQGEKVNFSDSSEPLLLSESKSAINSVLSILPKNDERRLALLLIWGYFNRIAYYSLSEETRPSDVIFVLSSDYQKWLNGFGNWKSVDPEGTVMQIIRLFLDDQETFGELKALLGADHLDLISDLKVETIPLRSPEKVSDHSPNNVAYMVEFCPSGHTRYFSFHRLSFGTKRVIQMAVSILGDKFNVAMIEQPEDGIHPALLYKIIPVLRSYCPGKQVIIASHAPSVLNNLDPSEIRLVELANGRTYARSLNEIEITAARNYLDREGPLADFVASL